MDPISAIGVASAAWTFVDFAAKLVKNVREIHGSISGRSQENEVRVQQAERLSILAESLVRERTSPIHRKTVLENDRDGLFEATNVLDRQLMLLPTMLSADEQHIKEIATECARWARNLQQLIINGPSHAGGLRILPGQRFGADIVRALREIWKDREIKDAEQFLERCRNTLQTQMTRALLTQSSHLQASLNGLVSNSVALKSNSQATRKDLEEIHNELVVALKSDETQFDQSKSVAQSLAMFHSTLASMEWYILQSLWFGTITQRRRQVSQRHTMTCDWIFSTRHADEEIKFSDWLENGEGAYWITGKPGSGKSTLMKYILPSNNEKTLEALKLWAQTQFDCDLVFADFFFWRPGNSMETTLEGLLRALLFEVFRQRPSIIAEIVPERWSEASIGCPTRPWSLEELKSAVESLGRHEHHRLAYCFFIDGLDEFAGPAGQVAEFVSHLTQNNRLKLVISSRPWNEFEHHFGKDPGLRVAIHEHTRDDIRTYVHDVLGEHELFASRQKADQRYVQVIETIVHRAQGVFLWVFLVIRALQYSLPNEDTFEAFEQQISDLPDELVPFFGIMLDNILPKYQQQSSKIILLFLRFRSIWGQFPLSIIRYLMEDKADLFKMPICEHNVEDPGKIRKLLKSRLQARCKDFFAADKSGNVHILHRTMLDFLETPDVKMKVRRRLDANFDLEAEILLALAADLKTSGQKSELVQCSSPAFFPRDQPQNSSATQLPHYQYSMQSNKLSSLSVWVCVCTLARYLGGDTGTLSAQCSKVMDEMLDCLYSWDASASVDKLHKEEKWDFAMTIAISHGLCSYVASHITASQISWIPSAPTTLFLNQQRWVERHNTLELEKATVRRYGASSLAIFFAYDLTDLGEADLATLKVLLEKGADLGSSHVLTPTKAAPLTCWQFVLYRLASRTSTRSEGVTFVERRESVADDTHLAILRGRIDTTFVIGTIKKSTTGGQELLELQVWGQLVILCVQYGANLDDKCVDLDGTGRVVVTGREIVKQAFAALPGLLVEIESTRALRPVFSSILPAAATAKPKESKRSRLRKSLFGK